MSPVLKQKEDFYKSNEYLAAIINSSDDAVIGKDLDGKIVTWNKGAEKTYGYSYDEVEGKHISILMPPENQNEAEEILRKIKEGGETIRYETIRKRKDANLIEVSLTVSPIKDSSGEIIGISTIARDITDRKNAERATAGKIKEIETMNKFMVGRELKMAELKKQIEELEKRCK